MSRDADIEYPDGPFDVMAELERFREMQIASGTAAQVRPGPLAHRGWRRPIARSPRYRPWSR